MRLLLQLSFLAILFSCTQNQDKGPMKDSLRQKPIIFFSGKPDIARHPYEITSASIGKLTLGDPLNAIPTVLDSIQTITMYKSGAGWPAKKIKIKNSEWVIAESINSVTQITGLYTNSTEFRTKKNYYIGMSIDSINFNQDSLYIDQDQKAFFLYQSGIWFKLDPISEKTFFKSKHQNIQALKNASINEFFILCGDC